MSFHSFNPELTGQAPIAVARAMVRLCRPRVWLPLLGVLALAFAWTREVNARGQDAAPVPSRVATAAGDTGAMVTAAAVAKPAEPFASGDELGKSGSVRLPITCKPEVREDFQTALALLHSFFYEEARRRFEDIAGRDPECAMAWWGSAMTWYHPLWVAPTPEEMAKGIAAVERAKAIGGKSDIERGLIAAIDAYYRSEERPADPGPVAPSCHGGRASSARADAYRASLTELHEQHPDELEVTIFYALSLLGSAAPTDKAYQSQLAAAAILEPLMEPYPDHPGIPHYLIHAYDYPSLARRGLVAARRYGDIAPRVPHALHMPSHIYSRLGMWRDSITSNLASSAAAREYTARVYGGATWYDELHALDYMGYAYLQLGEDGKAGAVVEQVRSVRKFHEPNFAAAYAIGALPARFALERRRWKEAAGLPVLHADVVSPYPFALAHTEFAHAVGAARSGQVERARAAVDCLEELRDKLQEPKFKWWIDQIEIQRLAGAAWLKRAEREDGEAVRLLAEAVALEDKAGTHAVTPGQILPAREQLGDLLLELGRPAEALVEYERSLEAFPSRFNSHGGAFRAAERAGKVERAREHGARLIELAGAGDGRREEVERARRYLAANPARSE